MKIDINWECLRCDYEVRNKWRIGESPNKCPKCGSGCYRLRFMKENKKKENPLDRNWYERDKERFSEAMGVAPNQVQEAMKIYPGSEYTKDGRLKIKNRAHKKFEMKRRGYTETA